MSFIDKHGIAAHTQTTTVFDNIPQTSFFPQVVLHHKVKGWHHHGPLYINKFNKLDHVLKHHDQYKNEKQREEKKCVSNSPNTRPKKSDIPDIPKYTVGN